MMVPGRLSQQEEALSGYRVEEAQYRIASAWGPSLEDGMYMGKDVFRIAIIKVLQDLKTREPPRQLSDLGVGYI